MSSTNPLRVLYVLPDLTGGGAERVTLTLLRFLDRRQVEPGLVIFRRQGAYLDEVPGDVPLHVVTGSGKGVIGLVGQVARLAKSYDVVVGALELKSIVIAAAAARLAKRPAVGWVHKHLGKYLADTGMLKRVVYRLAVRLVFPCLRHVVTVSRAAADAIEETCPAVKGNVSAVLNPLDLDMITARSLEPLAMQSVEAGCFLLAVGRLERQKGFDILLRAYARARARGVRELLVILGEGSERESLERMTVELGIGDSTLLPGFGNPYSLMRAARAVILSSRYEGLPTVLMEAQALGTPIISFDCPSGPSEILDEGRLGVLVPAEDFEALAEALLKATSQEPMTKRTESGKRHALEHYGPAAIAAKWVATLRSLSA